MTDAIETVAQTVSDLNQNQNVTGIIIQKPWRKTWQRAQNSQSTASEYAQWWSALTAKIAPEKDVDGLHPQTLQAIQDGTWQEQGRVLPATAQAVLTILEDINQQQKKPLNANKISIIGTSDLLGRPLFFELKRRGVDVELLGRKELQEKNNSGIGLQESSIIISATGVRHLITADLISEGTSLIDVGEPRPDVDFESVRASGKAAHITPVPGGVGPLTIVSLLQNAVVLAKQ